MDTNYLKYGKKYSSFGNRNKPCNCGCHSTPTADCSNSNIIVLECTRPLSNESLKINTLQLIENQLDNTSPEAVRMQQDIIHSKISISSFSNTSVNAIIIPSSTDYYYCVHEERGILLGLPFLIRLSSNVSQTTVYYFTVNLEELGRLKVERGVLIEFGFGFEQHGNALRRPGFWNNWTNCVNRTLNRFTDGSTFGAVMGLGCIAFGPECAAGISIGCAIQS